MDLAANRSMVATILNPYQGLKPLLAPSLSPPPRCNYIESLSGIETGLYFVDRDSLDIVATILNPYQGLKHFNCEDSKHN